MIYFSTLFISLFITIALIPLLRDFAIRANIVDIPNERKVHLLPIPKIGGAAMALGTLLPVIFWTEHNPFVVSLVSASIIIVIFGFLDDIYELGYKPKFAAQIAAGLIVITFGGVKIATLGMILPAGFVIPDIIAVPFTLLVIVGVTNAINLSDGLDGLAGGISLLGYLCIAYLAYQAENPSVAMFAVAMAGAIFGFLVFNTHPASIFMGDAGSQLLGFVSIALALELTQGNTPFSRLLPLILLGFPILDTLTVMIERIVKGVSPFKADKNHFHHKLMRLGLLQKEAVVCIYFIQSVLVIWAITFSYYSEWFHLILYLLFAGVIITGFTYADKSGWRLKHAESPDAGISISRTHWRLHAIKLSFRIVEFGLPGLLIITSLFAENIPGYFGYISGVFMLFLGIVAYTRKNAVKQALRVSLYLFIPFLTYLSQVNNKLMASNGYYIPYTLSFLIVFFFVAMTVKFTRRRKGFHSNPMDFLILFIALILPNVCWNMALTHQMGLLTVKILIFFFGFEILIGELRGKVTELVYPTVTALFLITAKAFI